MTDAEVTVIPGWPLRVFDFTGGSVPGGLVKQLVKMFVIIMFDLNVSEYHRFECETF